MFHSQGLANEDFSLFVMLVTAPSRSDHTVSMSFLTGTRLSVSAVALSDPF